MAVDILHYGKKPAKWRHFHCYMCGTVWRDDCNNDGALHVIMQCPVCGISCSDISRDEAVTILKQQAATEALELWNTGKSRKE